MTTRTRKKRAQVLAGRDTFHVLAPDGGQLAVKGEAPHALLVAQRVAEMSPTEVVLTVERRSLFGPEVLIYRVTRTENGTVFTNASQED